MNQQRSFRIFLVLWTAFFVVYSASSLNKWAGDHIKMFLTGERQELIPVEWEEFVRIPGTQSVIFPVSQTLAIQVITRKERPDEIPMPAQMLRVDRSKQWALMNSEPGWVFGVIAIFMPKSRIVMLVLALGFTIFLWSQFFSRKSSLDRHRERIRRRRRHKKKSKFPQVWMKVISILFLVLSALAIWWAVTGLIPNGNTLTGGVIAVIAIMHIPVMLGLFVDSPRSRSFMLFLPWTWMIVIPVGTLLGVITLAALPNLPALEGDPFEGE